VQLETHWNYILKLWSAVIIILEEHSTGIKYPSKGHFSVKGNLFESSTVDRILDLI
jgi:hypothetical protein